MLSGNGRHRRPRQAPAFVVAAGVTGSAIAIPLLGASGASAADGTVWNKVAECETGGSWSQNTGDGFYGGLHLTLEDWEKYGGTEYAERPDLASRSQQIAVAEKVLADQGVGAWPACGLLSGLTQQSGAADVDTGVTDGASTGTAGSSDSSASPESSASSDPADSAEPSGSTAGSGTAASPDASAPSRGASEGSSEASPSASGGKGSTTGSAATPGATTTPDAGAQEPDSSPTVDPKYDESDNSGQPVGSSGLVDTGALGLDEQGTGRHRGTSAEEDTSGAAAATTGRHAAPADGAGAGSYTVRVGDSLASIADSLDVDGGWHRLYDENKDAIGADPSHIVPGQTLRVGG
ncbi:LysM peptidoglycan-binding domain-containing protein [Streptomyces griseosporeus]|uniref:LysM peptidoglycan-binding domain-containing protein n=1 Tax=Streptomyces griseosporeus TaxID=1910 RepID=UPI00167EA233|nr:transglycosylase family protein [Streptomyces griseosporeus]GHF77718.1 peptidoglycan-binding protein LysM [Streptomyces griseosporeus]